MIVYIVVTCLKVIVFVLVCLFSLQPCVESSPTNMVEVPTSEQYNSLPVNSLPASTEAASSASEEASSPSTSSAKAPVAAVASDACSTLQAVRFMIQF